MHEGHEEVEREARLLEYILDRGTEGAHVLFAPELIRRAFAEPSGDAADRAEWKRRSKDALALLSRLSSVEELRAFIASLPEEVQLRLCYHYFALLDERRVFVYH